MALILIFYLSAGPFSSARGPRLERPIPPQLAQKRSQNATKNSRSPIYEHDMANLQLILKERVKSKKKRMVWGCHSTYTHGAITIIDAQIYFSIYLVIT